MTRRQRDVDFVPAEDEIIRLLWQTKTASEIAKLIDRSAAQVKGRANRLGIRKRAAKRVWTAEKDQQLIELFADLPTAAVAERLGLTVSQVNRQAYRLQLKKSPERIAAQIAEAMARGHSHPAVRANQFKKGAAPKNKGTRRPGWAPGRMAETQFRPGRPACEAANYVPIGSEKFDSKRGVTVRKITDDPQLFPANRWRPVHVLVWEAANGAIPHGHLCRFRDGMKTLDSSLITVDRLELVTLAENMRRNTLHRYPKHVVSAIQLRGTLIRKINRLTREHRHEKQD